MLLNAWYAVVSTSWSVGIASDLPSPAPIPVVNRSRVAGFDVSR
jgi:hypothetical protein